MSLDGSNLKQLTHELGYDGGPFFSWDGSKIVYRSYHPKTPEEIDRYKSLLADELIEPGNFQIWVMDADGGNQRVINKNEYNDWNPVWIKYTDSPPLLPDAPCAGSVKNVRPWSSERVTRRRA